MGGKISVKLIVGLGNPGKEYDKTRHNVGYMFLDFLTENSEFKINKKFNAMEYITEVNSEKVIYVKPTTFMNSSGEAVIKYVNYYKLKSEDILIIQDDLDMDTGKYKLMFNHGDGGHNGIKSIIANLNTREFLRLKIGISKTSADTKDYVLSKFGRSELVKINNAFEELENLVIDYTSMNIDLLIGKYNSMAKNNL